MYQSSLIVEHLEDDRWTIQQGFRFESETYGVIDVPVGFITDFASTPWYARWIIPTHGRHTPASVLHDYLLQDDDWDKANNVMLEAMIASNIKSYKRTLIYAGVSLWKFKYKLLNRFKRWMG